ncbi:uncharacterized protein LOC133814891 [Humulus lupulus]|uniref:uncharacterized protein LOC133814891 n=1 Tax=Humulus lupulus TaxID=3486 RepID=UPI002B4115DC|nr:uncharacterized protein LOC133814891 [Humulus lupulus]
MAMVVHGGVNPQELDPRVMEKPGAGTVEEVEEIAVMEEPLRKLKVGINLQDDTKEKLVRFLKENLDEHLGKPPLLAKPKKGERLYLYLAVSEHAISIALVRGEKRHHQPVYYVSKWLVDVENRYSEIEKLAYALVVASRKLRPYFHAHAIEVLTDSPLRQVLHKPDTLGRMIKWLIELSQFDITYTPTIAINGQVLADFIVEFTYRPNEGGDEGDGHPVGEGEQRNFEEWSLHVDGASNKGGDGAGIMMNGPGGHKMYCAIRFRFEASNNEAEYKVLLAGLRLAQGLKVTHLHIFSDSQLVVFQVKGEYQARGPKMATYLERVRGCLGQLVGYSIEEIPRERNTHADALAKLASTKDGNILESVLVEYLSRPSIIDSDVLMISILKESWVDPIVSYLKDGALPTDKREAQRLVYKAA